MGSYSVLASFTNKRNKLNQANASRVQVPLLHCNVQYKATWTPVSTFALATWNPKSLIMSILTRTAKGVCLNRFRHRAARNILYLRAMSFQEAASKLSPPLKDLVQNFTADNALGKTEKDQAEVVGWIEKVGSGHVQESAFQVRVACRIITRERT